MQRVIHCLDKPLSRDTMGEKAYSLMELRKVGFPVPDFYTIITDGSGTIHIDDAVEHAFRSLPKPLIMRSSHPMEGNPYPFSGIHFSPLDVYYLNQAEKDAGTEDGLTLEEAYALMIKMINYPVKGFLALEYIAQHNIEGYRIEDINGILMPQREREIFGMFNTSMQEDSDRLAIHYADWIADKGGLVIYDKKNGELVGREDLPENLRAVLAEFGDLATRTERFFWGQTQQVEIGHQNGKTELWQSRDFSYTGIGHVQRYANYKTFSTGLKGEGQGSFHVPVIVIDRIRNVDYPASISESRRQEAIDKYKREIREAADRYPEYAVFVKDGELFVKKNSKHGDSVEELNEITRGASVVMLSPYQKSVTHHNWRYVESGGVLINWITLGDDMCNIFIHNADVDSTTRNLAMTYIEEPIKDSMEMPPNLTLLDTSEYHSNPIQTGDLIHVISNSDGTFVWAER